ncbi:hypothetical protein OOZ15_07830 [Galbibacter sp. EGI 63066]|uniref:hypothetical protein n=1 Tax=Galbibacter sp. EGI 63066 TaxID=2993559 RepID=UPI002248F6F5|nr:hypothetical protein [Galbibacter sp. EGI 63066]MCX2679841.1 hypothetical protein [Galbibacter sp. EGI 63066]
MDLTEKDGEITGNHPALLVSYYTSAAGAGEGSTSPDLTDLATAYMGSHLEIVHVRVENAATGCHATTEIELQVVDAPAANVLQGLLFCDPDNDGYGEFDLSALDADVLDGQNPVFTR